MYQIFSAVNFNLIFSTIVPFQNVSPIAWHLGQNVLNSCADKIKPDLPEAVRLSGVAYHDYAEVVASICQVTPVRDSAVCVSFYQSYSWKVKLDCIF